jgi:hypothetical protein
VATIDLKIYYAGNTLRTQLEPKTYDKLVAAINAKSPWFFASNALGAPLILNVKDLLALEVIKKTFQEVRRPGLSLKEIATVSGLEYRKLFHFVSKLKKVDFDSPDEQQENALLMLSARRLAANDHNFDLLKIPTSVRAKLKKLEESRKTKLQNQE